MLSLDSDIAVAEEKLDLENLSGTELDTFIRQHRGLSRKYATYATATLRVVTGGGDIQAGNLFSTASGVEFYAIQDGTYTAGDTFLYAPMSVENLAMWGPTRSSICRSPLQALAR